MTLLITQLLPFIAIIAITIPLIKVFQGKTTVKEAQKRMGLHLLGFLGVAAVVAFAGPMFALRTGAEEPVVNAIAGTLAQGLGFLSAALATGMSALGAGIAVAAAAPAAIGAFSENDKNFGKAMIFVALGEGVAIYGLLISILIINKL
jgi:V/A-type H+-transporting ATPase subunit K